jgi:valyl-tRNA synthetase
MPMEPKYDAHEAEARIARLWADANAFAAGANAKPGAEAFSIVIPPPNVTGSLHMGHAFNNTLQDILTRWHRMRGHDTLWQPGTDHAGIATQMVVERELAKTNRRRTDFSREEFTSLVWDQKRKSRGNIRGQLERLGASCDWGREAFTMSGAPGAPAGEEGNFHDAVIKVFVDLYNKGLIYRGKRLVNWDPHFETAISDLEVEQTEVDGFMWHFKYPLAGGQTYEYVERDADGTVTLRETRDYISIATTRPETMLGDGAVAVHPSDERYAPIVGKLCEIPVGPKDHRRLIPIITDDYPDPTFGSGAVKITGAHDFNDYGVAQRNGIPLYRLMDTKARMRDDGVPYAEAAQQAQALSRAWLVKKGYVPPGFAEQPLNPSEAEIDALNLVPDELRGLDRYEARKRVVAGIVAEGLAVMTRADDPRLGKSAAKPNAPAQTGAPLPDGAPGRVGGSGAEATGSPTAPSAPDGAVGGPPTLPPDTPMVPLIEAKKIMQPFGDRSKVVIEPMLTDQWFVDTAKIVQPAIDAVRQGRTKILPEQHEKVYFHWLENIEPWCISRQLWWGHQIPVWYGPWQERPGGRDPGKGVAFCGMSFEDVQQQAKSWYVSKGLSNVTIHDFAVGSRADQSAQTSVPTPEQIEALENTLREGPGHTPIVLYRDPDVLDTWFSSGLWPIGTLGWPEGTPELHKYFPTSVLVTGFDIIFFWVARMMMMQLAVVDDIPFRTVYVHALVRDEKGKKMSKSLGNVLDPLDLIDEFGADAVRFTLASMAAMGRDLKLSKDRIAGYRNFTTKIWNAFRFAEMNEVFGPVAETGSDSPARSFARTTEKLRGSYAKHTVNRWILGEVARTRQAVDEALEAFRFNDAANALYAFVWGRVCDWYVEFAKPLLTGQDAEIAGETRATMAWVLDQCLLMLHPFMPFLTEDLWAMTGTRTKLLVHGDWPSYGPEIADESADREMTWVIQLIEEIRSARAQMRVPVGLKLPLVQVTLDDAGTQALTRNRTLIDRLARVDGISQGAAPKGSVTIPVDGGLFALPLEGVIDIAAEKARLSKTLEKLDKDIAGLRARLNNPKFVASAKEEVVEETREQLAAAEEEAAKLRAALARLAETG